MDNIIAVILCGGESKRMGSDKGLMPIHDTIWAKFMAAKLTSFDLPTVYAINNKQLDSYQKHIPARQLVIDNYELKGPAAGLLTAHDQFPFNNILLLACDMLELDVLTIKNLLKIYQHDTGHDYYVYQDEQYAQPLCGIYTAKGIAMLKAAIVTQSLKNVSMQSVLNNGDTKRITIINKQAFENYNSQV